MADLPSRQRGCVVAAFPATGKSHFAVRRTDTVDSDSSGFSWQYLGEEVRVRHSEWPANYMEHIRQARRGVSLVLVSTHGEVRRALVEAAIPFTLVYPAPTLREEYRQRMVRRGSPAGLVAKVIDELWESALVDCAAQTGCVHVVLRPGEYLSDVLGGEVTSLAA